MKEPFMLVLKEIIEDFEPHINHGIKKLRERTEKEEVAVKKIRTSATNYEINLLHLFTILDSNFSNAESSILDVEEFLNRMIQTDNIEDEKMLSFNNGRYDLTCMTVHKAKGLEFEHIVLPKTNNNFLHKNNEVNVFLNISNDGDIKVCYSVNLEELEIKNDLYSFNISKEDKEIVAEEIRLLYVALTRAKKSVHLNKNKIVSNSGRIKNWMGLLERGNFRYE
jgi:DNA helicase-2/ATP-dependent DNA helicase PcrA